MVWPDLVALTVDGAVIPQEEEDTMEDMEDVGTEVMVVAVDMVIEEEHTLVAVVMVVMAAMVEEDMAEDAE